MKNLSINFEIGFADSIIQTYTIKECNIILLLECWNAEIVEISFFNFYIFYELYANK
jgi:hypothetical protein